jgi:hypothetical protein
MSNCDLVSIQGYYHDDILELTSFQVLYAISFLDQQGNDPPESNSSTHA